MKKKIWIAVMLVMCTGVVCAQKEDDGEEEKPRHGFKKENMFTGGGINLSFFNGATVLGASPVLGYSINRFVDAGIAINFTYTGYTEYTGDRYRQFVYGPGVFARIYPINFLFAQAQYERNFITLKLKPADGSATLKRDLSVNSLLLGGGYCSGREGVGSPFYYLSIMVDVTRDPESPYTERLQNGAYRAIPIIRAGFNIPLFQGRRNRTRDY